MNTKEIAYLLFRVSSLVALTEAYQREHDWVNDKDPCGTAELIKGVTGIAKDLNDEVLVQLRREDPVQSMLKNVSLTRGVRDS